MELVKVKAPAKVNLCLNIKGVREDGYHDLESIMQAIDLCDFVEICFNDSEKITIVSDCEGMPCDKTNIAYRCAAQFLKYIDCDDTGVVIKIDKNIPMQAGLGGGSADGAAVLVGLNELFKANLTQKQLCEIGAKIGADIPFCIVGKTALAEGIGEVLTILPNMPSCHIVLVKPSFGISTAEAFKRFDTIGSNLYPNIPQMIGDLEAENLEEIAKGMCNVLEQAADDSRIMHIKKRLIDKGAIGAVMTGSGSAVFGIFDNLLSASRCVMDLNDDYQTFLCKPVEFGAHIIKKI